MTIIYMVRHGQASATSEDYDQLSPLGEKQAKVLGSFLAGQNLSVNQFISGTMKRHQQTARIALDQGGANNEVIEIAELNELDHKDVLLKFDNRFDSTKSMLNLAQQESNPKSFFLTAFNAAIARWTSGNFDDEYAEPWPEFVSRVQRGMIRLADKHGQNKIVFSSGGPISLISCLALGVPAEKFLTINHSLVNAGISKFVVGRSGKLKLSTLNQHDYLEQREQELVTYT